MKSSKFIKILQIAFIGSLFFSIAHSRELAYEECTCANKEFTDRVTNLFDNQSVDCKECENHLTGKPAGAEGGLLGSEVGKIFGDFNDPNGDVQPECILASNGRSNKAKSGKNQYRVCLKDRKTFYQKSPYPACGKKMFPRRYCFNKPYVDMTTKALNDVGHCIGISPKKLFPLFNHESRFILNNRSPTGAMCYGQLTASTVETLNNLSRLSYEEYDRSTRHEIPREDFESTKLVNILNKCPEVQRNFKSLVTKRSKSGRSVYYKGNDSMCDVVENPYTCLLYSAINHKRNYDFARNFLTIGKVWVSTNQKQGKQLIHKDEETKVFFDNKVKNSPKYNYLNYEPRYIFSNPDQVAEIAAYFAYNGGIGTVKVLFADYVKNLQRMLDNSRNKTLRKDFLDGGISTEFFVDNFAKYIKTHYKWGGDARKTEVSTFVKKILGDLKTVAGDYGKGVGHCSSSESFVYENAVK